MPLLGCASLDAASEEGYDEDGEVGVDSDIAMLRMGRPGSAATRGTARFEVSVMVARPDRRSVSRDETRLRRQSDGQIVHGGWNDSSTWAALRGSKRGDFGRDDG